MKPKSGLPEPHSGLQFWNTNYFGWVGGPIFHCTTFINKFLYFIKCHNYPPASLRTTVLMYYNNLISHLELS